MALRSSISRHIKTENINVFFDVVMSFTVKADKCCSAVNRTAEFHTIRATIYDFVKVGSAEVVEVEMPKVGVWKMFGNFLIYKIFIAMQSFKVEMI